MTGTTFSLMALAKALLHSGRDYYFTNWAFPDVAESRNVLTTMWFDKTDAEWMLQIDADMAFPPQLVIDMLAFGQPVTGCLYPKKKYPLEYVGYWNERPPIRDGFMKVEGIGFGVTLIHRSAVAKMLEAGAAQSDERDGDVAGHLLADLGLTRLIRAFDRIDTDRGRLSEDYSFCERHRQCGGEVWASIAHQITHIGLNGFAGRFADTVATLPAKEQVAA